MNKIWTIADIHGEVKMLQQLLGKLFREESLDLTKDLLVFTGDYVDRGKYSAEVLRILKNLQNKYPDNVIVLKGNHEDMMVKALTRESYDDMYLWKINGGTQTIKSFYRLFKWKQPPVEWLHWINRMPIIYKIENYVFSHAPLTSLNQYDNTELFYHQTMWYHIQHISGESKVTAWAFNNNKIGICGHIHRLNKDINTPRLYDHYIFNDSGCGCGSDGQLSAVEVRNRKVIVVGK